MDRADLSAAIIQEMGAVFMAALAEALPALLEAALAGMEQRLRQVGRAVLEPVVEPVAATREAAQQRGTCPECGGLAARGCGAATSLAISGRIPSRIGIGHAHR